MLIVFIHKSFLVDKKEIAHLMISLFSRVTNGIIIWFNKVPLTYSDSRATCLDFNWFHWDP